MKNKAYIDESSWSDSSSESEIDSDFEIEEYGTMCLMARDKDKVCPSTPSVEEVIDKYDELASLHIELEEAFDNLLKISETLAKDSMLKGEEIKNL